MTAAGGPPQVETAPPAAPVPTTIAVQRALERLRQERETFDQQKRQDQRWFQLRLVMGVVAVLIIPAVVIVCIWVLADSKQSDAVKTLASSALLVDVFSLAAAVWKIVLSPASLTRLAPLTADSDSPATQQEQ